MLRLPVFQILFHLLEASKLFIQIISDHFKQILFSEMVEMLCHIYARLFSASLRPSKVRDPVCVMAETLPKLDMIPQFVGHAYHFFHKVNPLNQSSLVSAWSVKRLVSKVQSSYSIKY